MFAMIFLFLVLFLISFFGIKNFVKLGVESKWYLIKTGAYAIVCASVAVFAMFMIYVNF